MRLDCSQGAINIYSKAEYEARKRQGQGQAGEEAKVAKLKGVSNSGYVCTSRSCSASAWNIWRYGRTEFIWTRPRDWAGIPGAIAARLTHRSRDCQRPGCRIARAWPSAIRRSGRIGFGITTGSFADLRGRSGGSGRGASGWAAWRIWASAAISSRTRSAGSR